jgi:CHRD domain
MRARMVGVVFVLGLVAVGVAVAGVNRNWSTHATGSLEVPARDTSAQAQAIFHLSKDGTELQYKLIASNIENVVQAHIHLGPPGANGPIGVFLYGLSRQAADARMASCRKGRSPRTTSSTSARSTA